ncbi:MAG: hypothetical protein V4507_00875 [Verrucomicrobiota bacterium]
MKQNIWTSITETFTPTRYGISGKKYLLFSTNRESQRRYCSLDRISASHSCSTLRMPFYLRKLKSIS